MYSSIWNLKMRVYGVNPWLNFFFCWDWFVISFELEDFIWAFQTKGETWDVIDKFRFNPDLYQIERYNAFPHYFCRPNLAINQFTVPNLDKSLCIRWQYIVNVFTQISRLFLWKLPFYSDLCWKPNNVYYTTLGLIVVFWSEQCD